MRTLPPPARWMTVAATRGIPNPHGVVLRGAQQPPGLVGEEPHRADRTMMSDQRQVNRRRNSRVGRELVEGIRFRLRAIPHEDALIVAGTRDPLAIWLFLNRLPPLAWATASPVV